MLLGARIVGDFGATIAIPIVFLSWTGKVLDARWGTAPYLLILGFVLAAALSAVSLTRKAKAYGRRYLALMDAEHVAKKEDTDHQETPTPEHD